MGACFCVLCVFTLFSGLPLYFFPSLLFGQVSGWSVPGPLFETCYCRTLELAWHRFGIGCNAIQILLHATYACICVWKVICKVGSDLNIALILVPYNTVTNF